MLTNFSRFIEYVKPRATIHNGPQGILTTTVELIVSSLTPKRLLKTQIFEKKDNLSREKKTVACFFRIIEHDECQR